MPAEFMESTSMKDNERESWNRERAQGYLDYADLHVIERKRTMAILERLFAYHFQGRTGLTLLDLGCGDGFVTEAIRSRHPDHTFCLMDGSDFMIQKAKERLKGRGLIFLNQTFESFSERSSGVGEYDFIYSANAIHHLDFSGKKRLYSKILNELKPGGLFLNLDPVAPSSDRSEQLQFKLWIDWMRETVKERNLAIESEAIENVPSEYKKKPENKPGGLIEQVQMLQEIGFHDVDCFYKYGIFALFGGTK
jgi:tRNA (cmo5U34)-methyltransferase